MYLILHFPGLQGFAGNKLWTDEWYQFGPEKISGLNYILAVDESSYNPKADWGNKERRGDGKVSSHSLVPQL